MIYNTYQVATMLGNSILCKFFLNISKYFQKSYFSYFEVTIHAKKTLDFYEERIQLTTFWHLLVNFPNRCNKGRALANCACKRIGHF